MNRNDGQYQFTHIFDEFLVPKGSKSWIEKQSCNPAVSKKKQKQTNKQTNKHPDKNKNKIKNKNKQNRKKNSVARVQHQSLI